MEIQGQSNKLHESAFFPLLILKHYFVLYFNLLLLYFIGLHITVEPGVIKKRKKTITVKLTNLNTSKHA
mgnify:CR=1 FL=1